MPRGGRACPRGRERAEHRSRRRQRRDGRRCAEARAVRPGAAGARGTSDQMIPPVNGDLVRPRDRNRRRGRCYRGIRFRSGRRAGSPGPLLFYWHGTGSRRPRSTRWSRRRAQEDPEQGGIIVSFQGSLGPEAIAPGRHVQPRRFQGGRSDRRVRGARLRHRPAPHLHHRLQRWRAASGLHGRDRSSYIAAVAPNSGGVVTRQTIQDPTIPSVIDHARRLGGHGDRLVRNHQRDTTTRDQERGRVRGQLQPRRRPLSARQRRCTPRPGNS